MADGGAGQVSTGGYVEKDSHFRLLGAVENAGTQTRFPHPAHLYRLIVSKDWMTNLCLDPSMRLPPGTQVARADVESNPLRAAEACLRSLESISDHLYGTKVVVGGGWGHPLQEPLPWHEMRGVVKLGFSWEAADVIKFSGVTQLADRLQRIFAQAQCTADCAIVQMLVDDADCEVRTFIVDGKPVHRTRSFTKFHDNGDGPEGRFTDFCRLQRANALHQFFDDNQADLDVVEAAVDALITRWLAWLACATASMPPVLRLDIFVRRRRPPSEFGFTPTSGGNAAGASAPGGREGAKCDVFFGELTELGACTLGWPMTDMMATLYPPVFRSVLKDRNCDVMSCKCKRPESICLPERRMSHQHWQGSTYNGTQPEDTKSTVNGTEDLASTDVEVNKAAL
uniref:Uncharacterized protein n=1 Tax=Octactis speculum TaxID=3111310 RepID=A0A7S2GG27_9STRA|mmetsp:Transcript_47590/g.64802  ORF Transcript_47590/g.64802 Transcript_47590/m.64802 type:complete len:397 (+) Transcript_47590:1-1191(+)